MTPQEVEYKIAEIIKERYNNYTTAIDSLLGSCHNLLKKTMRGQVMKNLPWYNKIFFNRKVIAKVEEQVNLEFLNYLEQSQREFPKPEYKNNKQ